MPGDAQSQVLANLQSQILEVSDRLDSIHRNRPETDFYLIPPFEYEPNATPVSNVQIVGQTQLVGVTHLALTWASPSDPNIEKFEIWAQKVQFGNDQPYKVADVTDAPATFSLASDVDVSVAIRVRVVMKNGLSTTLEQSPSVTAAITQTPQGSIAANSVGDTQLDRVTDPISVTSADILNATIATADIGNAQISTALIQNAAITNALIANLAVDNAKINDLVATKITAGTLVAGVILASNIAATQISAGTMTAVNISAGTYTLTSGIQTMSINGTDGFMQTQTNTGDFVRILGAEIRNSNSAESVKSIMLNSSFSLQNSTSRVAEMISGQISVNNSSGSQRASLLILANDGHLNLSHTSGTVVVDLNSGGTSGQVNSGYLALKTSGGVSKVKTGVNSSGDGYVDINSNFAVVHGTTKQKLVTDSVQLSSGQIVVNTGLSSISAAVAIVVSGGTPTENIGSNTPTGGTITFFSSNNASTSFIYYIILGTV